jgi:class 3 adenylate cyclase
MERKLTAVLCADVYGYSRLMGEDEQAMFRTLSSHRKAIDGLIEQHHGRFVGSAGDSILAEFASVFEAVNCMVEIQKSLKAEKANLLPPERRDEGGSEISLTAANVSECRTPHSRAGIDAAYQRRIVTRARLITPFQLTAGSASDPTDCRI